MINLKTNAEIEIIKANGRMLAKTLGLLKERIRPGVKTKELDRLAEDFIRKQGAYPAFKGYRGFPASICVSIDDEVVHGIPGERALKEGQVVSVDVGIITTPMELLPLRSDRYPIKPRVCFWLLRRL